MVLSVSDISIIYLFVYSIARALFVLQQRFTAKRVIGDDTPNRQRGVSKSALVPRGGPAEKTARGP